MNDGVKDVFENYKDVVNIYDMCKMLDIGINLAYRLLRENQIKYKRIGRAYRIKKQSIIDYMDR